MKNIQIKIEKFIQEIKGSYPKLDIQVRDFGDGFIKIIHDSIFLEELSTNFDEFAGLTYQKYFGDEIDVLVGFEYSTEIAKERDPYTLNTPCEIKGKCDVSSFKYIKFDLSELFTFDYPIGLELENTKEKRVDGFCVSNDTIGIPKFIIAENMVSTGKKSVFSIRSNCNYEEAA